MFQRIAHYADYLMQMYTIISRKAKKDAEKRQNLQASGFFAHSVFRNSPNAPPHPSAAHYSASPPHEFPSATDKLIAA